MAIISGLVPNCSGIICPKLAFQTPRYNGSKFKNNNAIQLLSTRNSAARCLHFLPEGSGTRYTLSVGRNHHELRFEDDIPKEPFWLITLIKEAFWAMKSLLAFLAEQPSQLKYIEWPSFQSTLKTATLTLVLVALLIVALSSVDAALSFLLALRLRRAL